MEIADFLTDGFLMTFTGTLLSVELIIHFTKELIFIKRIPTKIYTVMVSFAHLIIFKIVGGSLEATVVNIYSLFINALVISILLCGGYDLTVGKITMIKKEKNVEK